MTADEIRKWHKTFESADVTAEVARARARIEIAAQLAELNEFLREFEKKVTSNGTIDVTIRHI